MKWPTATVRDARTDERPQPVPCQGCWTPRHPTTTWRNDALCDRCGQ